MLNMNLCSSIVMLAMAEMLSTYYDLVTIITSFICILLDTREKSLSLPWDPMM